MSGKIAAIPLCVAILIAATGSAFAQGTGSSGGTSGGTAGSSSPGAAPSTASPGGPTVAPPSYNPSAVAPPPVAGTTPGASGSPPMVSAPAVPNDPVVPGTSATQSSATSSGGRAGCTTVSQSGTIISRSSSETTGTNTAGTNATGANTANSGIDSGTPRIANDPALGGSATVQTGRVSSGVSGPIVSGSGTPGSPSNLQSSTRVGC